MNQDPFCYFNGEITRYSKLYLHLSGLLIQPGYGIFDLFHARNWLNADID